MVFAWERARLDRRVRFVLYGVSQSGLCHRVVVSRGLPSRVSRRRCGRAMADDSPAILGADGFRGGIAVIHNLLLVQRDLHQMETRRGKLISRNLADCRYSKQLSSRPFIGVQSTRYHVHWREET